MYDSYAETVKVILCTAVVTGGLIVTGVTMRGCKKDREDGETRARTLCAEHGMQYVQGSCVR